MSKGLNVDVVLSAGEGVGLKGAARPGERSPDEAALGENEKPPARGGETGGSAMVRMGEGDAVPSAGGDQSEMVGWSGADMGAQVGSALAAATSSGAGRDDDRRGCGRGRGTSRARPGEGGVLGSWRASSTSGAAGTTGDSTSSSSSTRSSAAAGACCTGGDAGAM